MQSESDVCLFGGFERSARPSWLSRDISKNIYIYFKIWYNDYDEMMTSDTETNARTGKAIQNSTLE